MEFIFIFAVILFEVFLIHFPQVVEIIRAFGIDALMDDKVSAFFLGDQGIAAVRTAKFHRGEAAFIRGEPCSTDFAEKLALETVVFIEKGLRGITAWAGTAVWDIAF